MFAGVFVALGGISAAEFIRNSPIRTMGNNDHSNAYSIIAGFVLDLISIILIIIPVSVAVLRAMGVMMFGSVSCS